MMIGGGADRLDLVPLDTEGNRRVDHLDIEGRVVGCHTGPYAGLNVGNPQPNFDYQWENNPSQGGGTGVAAMHRIHQLGGLIVRDEDPEFAMYQQLYDANMAAPIDSQTVFREVALVRIPTERLRAEREALNELNLRRLRRGPEQAYVNSARGEEASRYGNHGPTRYRLSSHHSEFQEGGQMTDISTPDIPVEKGAVR